MTILYGGRVVTAERSVDAAVRIRDGLVVDVVEVRDVGDVGEPGGLSPEPGEEVLDCTGCLVVPGGVETHTHLDLECGPGLTTIDDFATGTRAALAGGTTTVLDFATQFHGQSLAEGLARWHAKADGRAVTDYAFHLAMTEWKPEFADEMAQVVADGVTSFKLYMAYEGSMMVTDDQILQALRAAAGLGVTIGFHCENGPLISERIREELAAGHTGVSYHPRTRPAEFEREAINRLGVAARLADAMHYVVHLSSDRSLPEIAAARERGARMSVETCPQYLLLDETAYGTADDDPAAELLARRFMMSPPLRPKGSGDGLWAALADGRIQFVGTDHCSFLLRGQKDAATAFNAVPNGAPGIELRMLLLYAYGVATGRLTPERYVAVTSTNAAKYFGLYPRKGTIAPGSDADIVVLDPSAQGVVRHADLHDGTDHTPYEGMATTGRIRDVFLRGQHLVRDGEPIPDLPPGTYCRCDRPEETR